MNGPRSQYSCAEGVVQMIRRGLFALLVPVLGSCIGGNQDIVLLSAKLQEIQNQVGALQKHTTRLEQQLEDNIAAALCRKEQRQVLDNIEKECPVMTADEAAAIGANCDTKQIEPAMIGADPAHKGRLLTVMGTLRHEAAYIRRGSTEIFPYRKERLALLASPRLLRTTRFVVVSYYSAKDTNSLVEARQRADAIQLKLRLLNNDIGPERIRIWLYSIPFTASEIPDPVDLPQPFEPKEFGRSVWVFRADC
jgi:hypothetical protein